MSVGDYIRTKDGIIAKITDIIDDYSIDCDRDVFDLNELAMMEIPWDFKDEYIIKSSPNIIDLIEVGDYVNGYLVKDIDYAFDDVVMNNKNARIVPYIDCNKDKYIDDIKSIVTKEQFSQMEYRIGD